MHWEQTFLLLIYELFEYFLGFIKLLQTNQQLCQVMPDTSNTADSIIHTSTVTVVKFHLTNTHTT